MTKILILIVLSFAASTYAQKNQAIISTPGIETLYVGYDNLIKVSFIKKEAKNIQLECEACDTIKSLNAATNEWIIRVDQVVPITIVVKNKKGQVIGEKKYKVFDLPEPKVFLDSLDAKSLITGLPQRIHLKLDPIIPVSGSYLVVNWTVKIDAKEYTGAGSSFSLQVLKAIKTAKTGILALDINYRTPVGYAMTKEIFEFKID